MTLGHQDEDGIFFRLAIKGFCLYACEGQASLRPTNNSYAGLDATKPHCKAALLNPRHARTCLGECPDGSQSHARICAFVLQVKSQSWITSKNLLVLIYTGVML